MTDDRLPGTELQHGMTLAQFEGVAVLVCDLKLDVTVISAMKGVEKLGYCTSLTSTRQQTIHTDQAPRHFRNINPYQTIAGLRARASPNETFRYQRPNRFLLESRGFPLKPPTAIGENRFLRGTKREYTS